MKFSLTLIITQYLIYSLTFHHIEANPIPASNNGLRNTRQTPQQNQNDPFGLGFGVDNNGGNFIQNLNADGNALLGRNNNNNAGSISSSSVLTSAAELTPGDLKHNTDIDSGIVISTGIGLGGGPLGKESNYAGGQSTALAAGAHTAAAGSGTATNTGGKVNTKANGQVVINRPDDGRASSAFANNFASSSQAGGGGAGDATSLAFIGDNLNKEFDATKNLAAQQQKIAFNNFDSFSRPADTLFPNGNNNNNRQPQPVDRGIVGNHAQSVLNTLSPNDQRAFNAVTGFDQATGGGGRAAAQRLQQQQQQQRNRFNRNAHNRRARREQPQPTLDHL